MSTSHYAITLVALASMLFCAPPVGSKENDRVQDRATLQHDMKSDPNIEPIPPNDPKAKTKSSASRSVGLGPGLGWIHVANQTSWKVDIFANKQFLTSVKAWGETKSMGRAGPNELYATAKFDNGDIRSWGPRHIRLTDETTWVLTPDE